MLNAYSFESQSCNEINEHYIEANDYHVQYMYGLINQPNVFILKRIVQNKVLIMEDRVVPPALHIITGNLVFPATFP